MTCFKRVPAFNANWFQKIILKYSLFLKYECLVTEYLKYIGLFEKVMEF